MVVLTTRCGPDGPSGQKGGDRTLCRHWQYFKAWLTKPRSPRFHRWFEVFNLTGIAVSMLAGFTVGMTTQNFAFVIIGLFFGLMFASMGGLVESPGIHRDASTWRQLNEDMHNTKKFHRARRLVELFGPGAGMESLEDAVGALNNPRSLNRPSDVYTPAWSERVMVSYARVLTAAYEEEEWQQKQQKRASEVEKRTRSQCIGPMETPKKTREAAEVHKVVLRAARVGVEFSEMDLNRGTQRVAEAKKAWRTRFALLWKTDLLPAYVQQKYGRNYVTHGDNAAEWLRRKLIGIYGLEKKPHNEENPHLPLPRTSDEISA